MTETFKKAALAAVGGALALSGCAPMEAPSAEEYDATLAGIDTSRACFFTREINGFSRAPDGPRGRERIYVHTGVREEWLVEARSHCPDLDFSLQIGFDTRGRTSLCTGDLETLVLPRGVGDGLDRCPVEILGRVIPQEEEGA